MRLEEHVHMIEIERFGRLDRGSDLGRMMRIIIHDGDATSLDLFHLPKMPAFNGQLTAIVQSTEQSGEIVFEAKAKGLRTGKIVLSAGTQR